MIQLFTKGFFWWMDWFILFWFFFHLCFHRLRTSALICSWRVHRVASHLAAPSVPWTVRTPWCSSWGCSRWSSAGALRSAMDRWRLRRSTTSSWGLSHSLALLTPTTPAKSERVRCKGDSSSCVWQETEIDHYIKIRAFRQSGFTATECCSQIKVGSREGSLV